MTVQGWPITVLVRGEVICDGGVLHGRKGHGQFLQCGSPEQVKPRQSGAGDHTWI
jgi:dihydropyrimidinase